MNTFRDNVGRNTVAITLLLLALAAVLVTRLAPAAVLAPAPDGTVAVDSFFDIFIEIEGVEGESTSPAHKGEIEVMSWSWGVSQTSSAGSGGGGGGMGGRTEPKGHVTLIKRIDKATPVLFKRCCDGTVSPRATVHLTRADGLTYLKYELKNVIVTSIAHADLDGDGLPDEKLELDFNGATLTYTQFDATGRPAGQISAEW